MCCRSSYVVKLCGLSVFTFGLLVGYFETDPVSPSENTEAPVSVITSETAPPPPDSSSKERLAAFEQVEKTIRERHWDPEIRDKRWPEICSRYRPRIDQLRDDEELDNLLREMLAELKQSHFSIIPQRTYEELNAIGKTNADGSIGAEFRMIDNAPMVWRVRDGSPADKAGLKPGSVIYQIDDKRLEDQLRKIEELAPKGLDLHLFQSLALQRLDHGEVGKTSRWQWRNAEDTLQSAEIAYEPSTDRSTSFGNLPRFNLRCECRMIDEKIAYFGLNGFFDPTYVLKKFETLVREQATAPGLIIDLRGNPGGLGFMAVSLSGWLVHEQNTSIGEMTTREGVLQFKILPRETIYRGKIAILVDELSMSTSEIFAGGLKDIQRARVFGRKTPGMALPSAIEKLPHGSGFQYAFANYVSANGLPLEALGVTPDEPITLKRETLLQGNDPDIDAAIRWIHDSHEFSH